MLYAKFRSRSHDAVIRAYDAAGNMIGISVPSEPVRLPRTFRSFAQVRERILPFCLAPDHHDSGRDEKAGACAHQHQAPATPPSELWPQPMCSVLVVRILAI